MTLKLFNFIFLTFLTVLLLWVLGWLWFATSIAIAQVSEDKTKTDAIIVLTGGHGRVDAGLDLLASGLAPKLFISGVNQDVVKADIFQNWKNKNINKKPCCVYLGYKSTDTISNAIEVQEWVSENKINSLRLVTSSYHMPRAYLEVRSLLSDIKIIKHPVFPTYSNFWKAPFWKITFTEYNKTIIRWMQNVKKVNS